MKKIFCLALVLVLTLCAGLPALAAKPGETVTVNISVDSNPSNACCGGIRFSFDSAALEFVSAEAVSSDVYVAPTAPGEDFPLVAFSGIAVGVKGRITFRINADAKPGVYEVRASAVGFVDANEKSVSVTVSGGSVTVEAASSDKLLGDVNGDGKIDGRDSVRLMNYLVAMDEEDPVVSVTIVEANTDLNEDGRIDGRDSVRLANLLVSMDE